MYMKTANFRTQHFLQKQLLTSDSVYKLSQYTLRKKQVQKLSLRLYPFTTTIMQPLATNKHL